MMATTRLLLLSSLLLDAASGLALGAGTAARPTAAVATPAVAADAPLPAMDVPDMEALDMDLLDLEERLQQSAATARNDSWERMLEASSHGFSDDVYDDPMLHDEDLSLSTLR